MNADPLAIPAFLLRTGRRLTNEEAAALNDVRAHVTIREPEHRLDLPPEGVGYADIFMNEGGWCRYIVTERGYRHVHLLYVPDLSHVKMDARRFADDVKAGAVVWYPLPRDLGERIRNKCVQWAMNGKRFSYRQVNIALVALGETPLETPETNNLPSPSSSKTMKEGESATKAPPSSLVVVDGKEYRSVLAAFQALGLPIPRHQKFRAELKKVGRMEFIEGKKKFMFSTGKGIQK